MALIGVATVAIIAILSALSLLMTTLLPEVRLPKEPPLKPKELTKFAKAMTPEDSTKQHIAKLRDPAGFLPFLLILDGVLGVMLLATLLDANDYSMHSMYRNRLIQIG